MEYNKIEELVQLGINSQNILTNVSMSKFTSFRIGGNCEYLIKIKTKEELKLVVKHFNKNKINFVILGNGSNLLVKDNGIKEVVLKIELDDISIEKNTQKSSNKVLVEVSAGTKMTKLGCVLRDNEITGFEELIGIPGTVGGAITMNAGAHKKEIKDIVKTVKALTYSGKEIEFTSDELKFGYRTSRFKEKEHIIISCELELENGNKDEIAQKIIQYANWRKENQPIEKTSAGSTFKRGTDFITAKLIDECGLKGKKVGGAMVSNKHAGFIINENNASAEDVIKLCEIVKKEVKNKFDKNIELEIEIIGE